MSWPKHYPEEASHGKMRAAQTGGSGEPGPTEFQQKQAQQTAALEQQATTAGAQAAQQAQSQQTPVNATPGSDRASGRKPTLSRAGEGTTTGSGSTTKLCSTGWRASCSYRKTEGRLVCPFTSLLPHDARRSLLNWFAQSAWLSAQFARRRIGKFAP